jgi:hypothetical protein
MFFAWTVEDSRVETLWQQLRALTGAERRLLETVLIHNTALG